MSMTATGSGSEGRVLSHGANSSVRRGVCVFLHPAPNAVSGAGVLPSD